MSYMVWRGQCTHCGTDMRIRRDTAKKQFSSDHCFECGYDVKWEKWNVTVTVENGRRKTFLYRESSRIKYQRELSCG